MAVAHHSDREIPRHAGLYSQVRLGEVGYEEQIYCEFGSLRFDFGGIGGAVDRRGCADDRVRCGALGAA